MIFCQEARWPPDFYLFLRIIKTKLLISFFRSFNFLKLCSNNKLFKKNNKNTVAKYKHLMLKYNLDKKAADIVGPNKKNSTFGLK